MSDERSPADVRAFLDHHGLAVQELNADTSTAQTAAHALQTSVGSIAKSLLFIAANEPVLVVASGDTRVDQVKLASFLGTDAVRLAKPKEVVALTGYRVGGVPPVAHAHQLRVLMDRALFDYPTVYADAGSPLAIFPVEPVVLQSISGAELVDVTEG